MKKKKKRGEGRPPLPSSPRRGGHAGGGVLYSFPILFSLFHSSSQTGSSVWPLSSLPSPSPPLSEGEGYLDEGTSSGEVLLSLVDCSEETRGEITESSVCRAAADRAVIPNDDLDPAEVLEGQWASWDPAVDRDWEEFIDNLQTARLKDARIPELSKPSGPRVASLCFLWHYPTYRTDQIYMEQRWIAQTTV
ncbi:hypothetical protein J3E69DRAFT_273942 [Trichoderma sp. SZMC 28015]